MFNSLRDIDLQQLKRKHARLYYFGLGFIQLKIDETWRLHFYSPELLAITEDTHNHRYNFESKILKGKLKNKLYRVDTRENDWQEFTHKITNESCNVEIEAPSLEIPCYSWLDKETVYKEGDSYTVNHNDFHRVEATNCITLLKRSEYTKEFAQVVLPKESEGICPFSKRVEEDKLWKIMEEMLI